jgi:hypothetical protein
MSAFPRHVPIMRVMSLGYEQAARQASALNY